MPKIIVIIMFVIMEQPHMSLFSAKYLSLLHILERIMVMTWFSSWCVTVWSFIELY